MQVSLYFGEHVDRRGDCVRQRDGRGRSKMSQALVYSGLRAAESAASRSCRARGRTTLAKESVRNVCSDRRKPRRPF